MLLFPEPSFDSVSDQPQLAVDERATGAGTGAGDLYVVNAQFDFASQTTSLFLAPCTKDVYKRQGLVWTMSGGIPVSRAFAKNSGKDAGVAADFSFVQISDSHIGFNKPANPDVTATLQTAINKINAMPRKPDFIIHTGDLSQLSKPSEFDTLDQTLKGVSAKQIYFVPGEHDMLSDNGEQYLERYGKGTKGTGYYSFDHKGVHFVGLVNVANLKAGGMGSLGHEQLEWFEDDLKGRSHSTPIVLFAHIPLWTIYPDWGLSLIHI